MVGSRRGVRDWGDECSVNNGIKLGDGEKLLSKLSPNFSGKH